MSDKIYISGKISAETPEQQQKNEQKFYEAEKFLTSFLTQKKVINPVRIARQTERIYEDASYKTLLYNSIEQLWDCDMIYMLKNWKSSKGARVEHALAQALDMDIIYE